MYRAHCAVIFAIAQLSCMYFWSTINACHYSIFVWTLLSITLPDLAPGGSCLIVVTPLNINKLNWNSTRKLCYRKDDRTVRPIGLHGCPENFRVSLTTPTATIPNIFHGLLFGLTLWMFLQNLKSVALPVPEITGGTQKNLGTPRIRPRSLFSEIFNKLLFGMSL